MVGSRYYPQFEIIDVAPIFDRWQNEPGFIVAASPFNLQVGYPGVEVYFAIGSDTEADYAYVGSIARPAIMGEVLVALTDISPTGWDRTSTVEVAIFHSSLDSVTEDRVLQGANRVLIGDEVLAYATATQDADDSSIWVLDTFLRKLAGTSQNSPGTVGDRFIVLNPDTLLFVPCVAVGETVYVKVLPPGYILSEVDAQSLVFQAGQLMPPEISHLKVSRNGKGDASFSWSGSSTKEVSPVTSGHTHANWQVEILGALGEVLRVFELTSPEFTYLDTEQTADGLTPGNPVTLRISQASYFTRGFERTETL